ncbi:MAG: ribosome maturation factor RimP [Candidatus Eisenbacteria bacterium]
MERMDEKLYSLSRGLVEGMGFVLVDVDEVVEHGRRTFRFCIDAHGGVSLEDCGTVSREVSYLLDAEPELASGYVLEVSSPGLDHRLKKEREYVHFAGREARLVLRDDSEGRNVIEGVIGGAEGGVVRIALTDGEELSIPLTDIARARLTF